MIEDDLKDIKKTLENKWLIQILSVRRTKMGIEDDLKTLKICCFEIEKKLDKLLEKEQPKDRQDKEKAIKETLTKEQKEFLDASIDVLNKHTEMG